MKKGNFTEALIEIMVPIFHFENFCEFGLDLRNSVSQKYHKVGQLG
jgi:hypothetical protein